MEWALHAENRDDFGLEQGGGPSDVGRAGEANADHLHGQERVGRDRGAVPGRQVGVRAVERAAELHRDGQGAAREGVRHADRRGVPWAGDAGAATLPTPVHGHGAEDHRGGPRRREREPAEGEHGVRRGLHGELAGDQVLLEGADELL